MKNIIKEINSNDKYANYKVMFNEFVFEVYRYDLYYKKNDLLNEINRHYGRVEKYSKLLFPNLAEDYLFSNMLLKQVNRQISSQKEIQEDIVKLETKKQEFLKFPDRIKYFNQEIQKKKEGLYPISIELFVNGYKTEYVSLFLGDNTKTIDEDELEFFNDGYFGEDNDFSMTYRNKVYELCTEYTRSNTKYTITTLKDVVKKHNEYISLYKGYLNIEKELNKIEEISQNKYASFILENVDEVSNVFCSLISNEALLGIKELMNTERVAILNMKFISYSRFFNEYPDSLGETFKFLFNGKKSTKPLLLIKEEIEKKTKSIDFKQLDEMLYISETL